MVETGKAAVALAVVVLGVSFLVLNPVNEEERPNVVFITVDALRADRIGTYGYDRNTSPNIDRFASESTVFTNATSPSASTIYAMPSVFTSLYPVTDNVVHPSWNWNTNLSLVQRFQENGYRTSAVVAHTAVKSEFGFDTHFDAFDDNFTREMSRENYSDSLNYAEIIPRYYERRDARETTDIAVQHLDGERPFFLWLHYVDPHDPYVPPEEEYIPAINASCESGNETETYRWAGKLRNLTGCQMQRLDALYDSEVRYVDSQFGRLIGELRDRDIYGDTVVVLTADHGECLGEHGIIDHNRLYRCSLNVPLIVHVPGKEPARLEKPVSTIDVFPTLLDILDIEVERFTRGENLFSENRRGYQYAENPNTHVLFSYGGNVTVQDIRNSSYTAKGPGSAEISDEILERLEAMGYR